MKYVSFLIYLFLLTGYEVLLKESLSNYGIYFNFAAFIVLLLVLHKSEQTALWFGFAAGVTLSAGNPHIMGYQAASLAALGLVSWQVSRRLNLESFNAKLLLIFTGILVHNIITVVFSTPVAYWVGQWYVVLMGAIYTGLLAALFIFVQKGELTVHRIKAIF